MPPEAQARGKDLTWVKRRVRKAPRRP